jgi:outer membrane protein assembly factor BamB
MKPFRALFCLTAAIWTAAAVTSPAASNWNRFRGPNGTGNVESGPLPDAVDAGNTLWSVPVDKGWSSPVLWGDLLVITAETGDNKRAVIAHSAADGRELWRHEEAFQPHKLHKTHNSFASSTPFVDDRRVYVNWSDGHKIQALALDHAGKLLWRNKHVADYIHEHGTGASPIVEDGVMIVRSEFQWNPEDAGQPAEAKPWIACITGLDAATGRQLWRLEVPHTSNSYSTPVIRALPGGAKEVICANTRSGVVGIDIKSGGINWQHNPGFRQRSVGSGVLSDDFYFCTFGSGGGVNEVAAIDLKSGKPVAASFNIPKGLPYTPSPLVIGDYMYLLGDGGILRCVEFKTGNLVYEQRVDGVQGSAKFFSSPVAADGKIYCGSQQGDLIVIKAGPKFERISATRLGAPINATPAIANGRIYIRTARELLAIGAKAPPAL